MALPQHSRSQPIHWHPQPVGGCRLGELLISSHVWGLACLLTAQGGLPALGDTLRGQNQQPHGVRQGGGERA